MKICKEHDPGVRLSCIHQLPTGTLLAVCELFVRNNRTVTRMRFRESQIEFMASSEPEDSCEVSSVATLINSVMSLLTSGLSAWPACF
jgi:hypothetical protein